MSGEKKGTIAGTITDPDGAPLAQVTVIARSQTEDIQYNTVSKQNGQYSIKHVRPGSYSVEAGSIMLEKQEQDDVVVPPGATVTVDFVMNLTPISED